MTKTNLEIEEEFDERFPNWTSEDIDGFKSCYLDGGNCGTSAKEIKEWFISKLQQRIDEIEKGNYIPTKYLDVIPEYKTKEQLEMFIESRKEDIKVLKEVIKKAEKAKSIIKLNSND